MRMFIVFTIFTFIVLLSLSNTSDVDLSNIRSDNVLPADVMSENFPKLSNENEGISTRITGGKIAKPHQFPYQVGLFLFSQKGISFCGGSLIEQNWVVTAAHCIYRVSKVYAFFGANILGAREVRMEIPKNNLITHEGYNPRSLINDIALIKLPIPVPLNDKIQTIKLAPPNTVVEGNIGIASGWGRYNDSSSKTSNVLRYAELKMLPLENCMKFYRSVIRPSNICVDGSNRISVCQGDSGGPLAMMQNEQLILVGVTSFGSHIGCEKGIPVAFTRISSYLNWIAEHTGVYP